jgi:hypothetical protein
MGNRAGPSGYFVGFGRAGPGPGLSDLHYTNRPVYSACFIPLAGPAPGRFERLDLHKSTQIYQFDLVYCPYVYSAGRGWPGRRQDDLTYTNIILRLVLLSACLICWPGLAGPAPGRFDLHKYNSSTCFIVRMFKMAASSKW